MDPAVAANINTFLLAVSAGLLAVVSFFVRELHAEFKTLRTDVRDTRDRVLVLETRTKDLL